MPLQIGRNFRTYEGARKRARFERAHQDHLMDRYDYIIVSSDDRTIFRVFRVKPGTDPQKVIAAITNKKGN